MSELVCRLASPADVEALLSMMADFNAGEGISPDPARHKAAVLRLIQDENLGLLPVFQSGGTVAGYAVLTWGFDLEFGGRDSFLTELYLRPEFRGQGRGRAALNHIEKLAREHGAAALHLGVRPDNDRALRLYEQAGFEHWTRRFMTRLL